MKTLLLSSFLVFALFSFVTSCNQTKADEVNDPISQHTEDNIEMIMEVENIPSADMRKPSNDIVPPEIVADRSPTMQDNLSSTSSPDEAKTVKKDFKVVLSVDSLMYLEQSGIMQVWIGQEDIDVTFSKGMAQDIKKMSSSIGRFAKIVPYAPDFDITAIHAEACYKIDPSGSEIRYSLIPKDEGEYKVSVDIELYDTEDCTGISVPKTARALTVFVGVNMQKEVSKKIHEMEGIVWDKFKVFWIALITLIFGAAIFVIRRFVKNKTGFQEPPTPPEV